jgi:hypothetical protein
VIVGSGILVVLGGVVHVLVAVDLAAVAVLVLVFAVRMLVLAVVMFALPVHVRMAVAVAVVAVFVLMRMVVFDLVDLDLLTWTATAIITHYGSSLGHACEWKTDAMVNGRAGLVQCPHTSFEIITRIFDLKNP